jgi:elongation factor 1-gamma
LQLFIKHSVANRIFTNILPYHKGVFNGIVDQINERLAVLDKHLNERTWLVSERITIADVFVGSALAFLFAGVFDAAQRKKVPNVVRYFET